MIATTGLTVEIPWRKSKFPGDDYIYIAQARGHVGSAGRSGFKTEIECEILGHNSSTAHQISVGLELWNSASEAEGRALVLEAIEQISVKPPAKILEAFKTGKELSLGDWEVADESSEKLKEIRVDYRPDSATKDAGT